MVLPSRSSVGPSLLLLVVASLESLGVVACGKHRAPPDAGSEAVATEEPADPPSTEPRDETPPPPDPPVPDPLATTCEGVSLVLSPVRLVDGKWLDATLELRNDAKAWVPIMLSGDGSLGGRRNPAVTFELRPDRALPAPGCGNMDPLNTKEIVFLEPGGSRALEWLRAPTPSKPGSYTLRATYVNDPRSSRLGHDRPGRTRDALVARVRKTVPCSLTSNVVTFDWK